LTSNDSEWQRAPYSFCIAHVRGAASSSVHLFRNKRADRLAHACRAIFFFCVHVVGKDARCFYEQSSARVKGARRTETVLAHQRNARLECTLVPEAHSRFKQS
jgi:hypothetical protein